MTLASGESQLPTSTMWLRQPWNTSIIQAFEMSTALENRSHGFCKVHWTVSQQRDP